MQNVTTPFPDRQAQGTENPLRELVTILFMQKWLIQRVALLVFLMVLAVLLFWPSVYQIDSTVLLKSKQVERTPEMLEETMLRVNPVNEDDLNSEVAIITSQAVLRQAVERLVEQGLWEAPEDEAEWVKATRGLAAKLGTKVVPSSKVIRISLAWPDPDEGSEVLQSVVNSYLTYRTTVFEPDTLRDLFTQQTDNYSAQLSQRRAEKMALIETHQAAAPAQEIEQNLTLLRELKLQLSRLDQEAQSLTHRQQKLAQALDEQALHYFSFIDNVTVQKLTTEIQSLVSRQTEMSQVYLPDAPPAKALAHQIDQTYDILREEISNLQQELSDQAALLRAEINTLNQRMMVLNQRNVELQQVKLQLERLDQEIKLLGYSYETFYKRREQADIQSRFSDEHLNAQVVVLVQPEAQLEPLFPRWKTMLPVGLIVALITGICIGFINEFFDHSFKRAEDSQQHLGLPTLLSLPHVAPASQSVSKGPE
ncbi:GumC family protein [Ferrimonas balearica]|uniref:GumC family protein n=1 Tax=Ferrimonas balearica TaxID=44012 RepID=UPI001C99EB47|nr:Wzz/FepE/Etk N-terminal domain-containing protein [Ferrimonas balearica]MBY5923323.1 hypothetical protein [Ferrimonas balearica]MBY5995281.1 hypothetical protein [Ferrimonas balearica]